MVGLTYFAPLTGVLIGAIYAGRFGDWVVLKIVRRNNGMWESEHRLWLTVVPVFLAPASLLLWGVGAAQRVHWFGLIFAMALTGCTVTIGAQLAVSYCIDTCKDLGGDAIVSVSKLFSYSISVSYKLFICWTLSLLRTNTYFQSLL